MNAEFRKWMEAESKRALRDAAEEFVADFERFVRVAKMLKGKKVAFGGAKPDVVVDAAESRP